MNYSHQEKKGAQPHDWHKVALTVLAFGLLLWITGGLGAAAGASGGSEAVLAALGLA